MSSPIGAYTPVPIEHEKRDLILTAVWVALIVIIDVVWYARKISDYRAYRVERKAAQG